MSHQIGSICDWWQFIYDLFLMIEKKVLYGTRCSWKIPTFLCICTLGYSRHLFFVLLSGPQLYLTNLHFNQDIQYGESDQPRFPGTARFSTFSPVIFFFALVREKNISCVDSNSKFFSCIDPRRIVPNRIPRF